MLLFFISFEQEGLGYSLFKDGGVGPVRVSVKSLGARIPRSDHMLSHPVCLSVPPIDHSPSFPDFHGVGDEKHFLCPLKF